MNLRPSPDPLSHLRLVWRASGSAALLVVVGGWWLLVGQPTVEARQQLIRQSQLVESLAHAEATVEARCAKIAEEFSYWEEQEQQLAERIASRHDESAFLQWVNQQAGASGLELRDFRPIGRESSGEFEGRSVTLASQGSFESICRFLDHLRGYARMNRVVRFEITPRDLTSGSFTCTLQIVLYSRPEVPAAVAQRS